MAKAKSVTRKRPTKAEQKANREAASAVTEKPRTVSANTGPTHDAYGNPFNGNLPAGMEAPTGDDFSPEELEALGVQLQQKAAREVVPTPFRTSGPTHDAYGNPYHREPTKLPETDAYGNRYDGVKSVGSTTHDAYGNPFHRQGVHK